MNDRNSAGVYIASGNITQDTLHHVYDSAGRLTSTGDFIGGMSIAQDYDGDGQPVKRIEDRQSLTTPITTYYLRSSVLGGQVVTEVSTTGFRSGTHNTHIYVNGSEIARYDSWLNQVLSKLSNLVTGSGSQELDPLGGYVGFVDPFVQNPNTTYDSLHPGEALYFQDANPFDPGSGCEVDGLPTDCSRLAHELENGTVGIQIGGGGKIYNVSNFQFGFSGGMWVSQPTPSEAEYDDDLPPLHLKVTDNAYEDVWVAVDVAKRQPQSVSPGQRAATMLKDLIEFIAGLLPGHSEQCLRGLRTAGQNRAAINRANENQQNLRDAASAHGVDWRILAAVSIRETGFRNIAQESGPGRAGGYFQIDFNAHPSITAEQAYDIDWAANWTATQFGDDINEYEAAGFTPELSVAGAIRNHNTGSKFTLKKLTRDSRRGGLRNLNAGTWHNNYVSNVLDLIDCFPQ